jgi:hypothetical protein
MFRTVSLPIIRSSFTVQLAIQVLLKGCLQTCMTYTSAKCRVNELLIMGTGTVRNV